MINFLISLLLNGLTVYLAAFLLPGVEVSSFVSAIFVSLLLTAVNIFVKPIFTLLTLPITVFSFGIFLFFINGFMVLFVSWLLAGFAVNNIIWAMLFSFLLSVLNTLFGNEDVLADAKKRNHQIQ